MKNILGKEPTTEKGKKNKTLWIILGGLGLVACLCLAAVGAIWVIQGRADLLEYEGISTRQNPADLGTSAEYKGISVVIKEMDTTIYTEDRQHYSPDGFRVITHGSITCTLPEGEICTVEDVEVILRSSKERFLDLYFDEADRPGNIPGGETIDFRLQSHGWIHMGDDFLSGSLIEFRVKLEGDWAPHALWFDTGYE
jgi:hypothetical protein